MKIRLGYACISKIIDTTSSKTTTLTYYNKLDTNNKFVKIDNIIKENLYNLEQIIKYNIKNNIHFFRSHNEYIYSEEFIKFVEMLKKYNRDIDIMLEAKAKDLALVKLVYELKFKENYHFIDESSFTI